MKTFGYPTYDAQGEMILSTYDNAYKEMLMDVRVYFMKAGASRTFSSSDEEIAVLLLNGNLTFCFDEERHSVTRKDVFTEGSWCVHICQGDTVVVEANADTEILVQKTKNEKRFAAKLYRPEDAPWRYVGVGKFGDVAKRRVSTIFDLDIAPYSNMVLGEVLNDRGNWSGYLPHCHPQPELYYFLFDRPEGFGASFVGDEVFKSVNQSFSAIPGGLLHPQAVAPGFQMYTCWMIRHLDGQPWHQTDRNEDEKYMWLHEV
ncbi:MAG: 5-deoxy-glucuronate isomerase [Lachnospiraceae bacterium]|nr:5-deoxy-glucuronate isomerase [Lachnospiraceae bacterium]